MVGVRSRFDLKGIEKIAMNKIELINYASKELGVNMDGVISPSLDWLELEAFSHELELPKRNTRPSPLS